MSFIINPFISFPSIADPIHQISNLIVDLNSFTILNASGGTATEGQEIYNWSNAITGNAVSGASQSLATRYPIMQTVNGNREVKFDGSNDFLTFGNPAELDFKQGDDFTITLQMGSVAGQGALYHKGQSTLRQFGLFFFPEWNPFLFNVQYSASATLSAPNMVIHYQFKANTNEFTSYLNNTLEATYINSATGYSNLDTLLGARQNNAGGTTWAFFYAGAFRRVLVWNKVLTTEERVLVNNELKT